MKILSSMIIAAAVITAISAAPASARHLKHPQVAPMQAFAAQGGVPYQPGAWHAGPDPYGVYFGNQMVGRDPDPNVRQQLKNDYSYLYSW